MYRCHRRTRLADLASQVETGATRQGKAGQRPLVYTHIAEVTKEQRQTKKQQGFLKVGLQISTYIATYLPNGTLHFWYNYDFTLPFVTLTFQGKATSGQVKRHSRQRRRRRRQIMNRGRGPSPSPSSYSTPTSS